jgi:hypothetical protein
VYRVVVAISALLLALTFAVHLQAATSSPAQSTVVKPVQRWEYITLFKADGQHWFMHVLKSSGTVETPLASSNSRQDAGELKLAQLGALGWELIGAVGTPDASSEVLYLKRALP